MLDFSSLDMKLNPSYLVLVFKTRNREIDVIIF